MGVLYMSPWGGNGTAEAAGKRVRRNNPMSSDGGKLACLQRALAHCASMHKVLLALGAST